MSIMQNRNVIKIFAILFAIVCLYQLSFTWVTDSVEKDAVIYASKYKENEREAKEKFYLDSINSEEVYDILLTSYTYAQCKQREINLGLDLKGGMNVTLEVMVVDVIKALSNNSKDSIFNLAINNSLVAQQSSQDNFVTLFALEYEKLALTPNKGLSSIFSTPDLRDKIQFSSSNKEVIDVLSLEVEDAIDRSFNILRSRIDRFGVTQPNIQRLETAGRILVELPGIKNPDRARKLLQSTAQLDFWETYEYSELYPQLDEVNTFLKETKIVEEDSTINEIQNEEIVSDIVDTNIDTTDLQENVLLAGLENDTNIADTSSGNLTFEEFAAENPLYALLYPNVDQQSGQLNTGPVVGFCAVKDTVALNEYLNDDAIKKFLPIDVKFAYTVKANDAEGKFVQLVALKTDRSGEAIMEGDVVTDANQEFGQFASAAEVSMTMNAEGAKQWKRLTAENIGKSVAIVLDGYVYSFPTVQSEISGGRSQITGNFTVEEAKDLANILKSGKLPAPARIIEEAIVGPSLGEEAINSGLQSFIVALVLVLMYMIFYYSGAGLVSNVALLANIFFIFGVLSSLGAVLTLPGIAGIVLTIGMAVDANVLIFERIREEIVNGKTPIAAVNNGYSKAIATIIDANITTLIAAVLLFSFGSGPVKGFSVTLALGILSSMFTAITLSKLIIFIWLRRIKPKTLPI